MNHPIVPTDPPSSTSHQALQHDHNFTPKSTRDAKSTAIIQIASAVLYCILGAGIVFGYAALKPILIEEHVYRELCTQQELDDKVRLCVEQEIRLNLMFTVAAVATNVAALPVGAILDKYGPRICGFSSSILHAIGALSLAYSSELSFDGYLLGYFFLAVGSCFLYVPSLHLSNSIPNHSGLVLALLAGSFDSSSALFFVYQKLYFGNSAIFGLKNLFLGYLIVPTFVFWVQATIMPNDTYKSDGGHAIEENENFISVNQISETTALLREEHQEQNLSLSRQDADDLGSITTPVKDGRKLEGGSISGVCQDMYDKPLLTQICSLWFILLTLYSIIQMTRINYFIATIRSQYDFILGSYEEAVEINSIFDTALPLGGLIAIPFIGVILDNLSLASIYSMNLLVGTSIGILGCFPYKWAAYLNIFLFVLYRPFFYTAISDFVSKVFGFRTFGKINGILFSLAGIFNLTANGLDKLRYNFFRKNPIPINIFLLIISSLIGAGLCIFVKLKSNDMKRRYQEFAAHKNQDNTEV